MKFNISYDIVALVLLIILSFKFFNQKRFPIFSNELFGFLLIIGDLNLFLDIVSSICINNSPGAPIWLAYLTNSLYYITQLAISGSVALYMIALVENKIIINKKIYSFALIPSLLFVAIFVFTMPLGLVFKIMPSGEYVYGPFSKITYICVAIHLAAVLFVITFKRNLFTKLERFSMYALCALAILASIIQFFFPSELLTGFAISISFLIMYFAIQDPQYALDADTGTFTADA